MKNEAIVVKDVSMRFNLSRERVDNAKEYFVKKIKKQLAFDEFYALRNVSFSIEKGDSFAIIGENGCGKSTLLKVISGIYYPTTGSVEVEGTISPLIELGAGFDMDLTARENIYLNGAVLGRSKEFVDEHFNEIMDFAELWDFVDVPLKNFSSGMIARLGFSIATTTVPDILIVDEILAVGDINFQAKCHKKMEEMLSGGTTLLFVSHDINQIKSLCKNAVWINKGIVQMVGDAETVADAYVKDMTENGGKGIVHPDDVIKEVKVPEEEIKAEAPKRKHHGFAFWLRAFAAMLVAYHHVINALFVPLGHSNLVVDFISNHIITPFGLDLGYLGVVIFFMVSGFLNIESLRSNSSFGYIRKKLSRIFPALIVAMFVLWSFSEIVSGVFDIPTYWEQFTFWQWVQAATLVGHFTGVSNALVGITWFLVPLLMYYVLSAVLKPILKISPIAFTASILLASAAFTFGLSYLGGMWFITADYMRHIPTILFGQILYFCSEKILSKKESAILFILSFITLLQNIRLFSPGTYTGVDGLATSSILVGLIIVFAAYLLNDKLSENAFVRSIDNVSYSLYLSHYQVAQLFLPLLIEKLDGEANIALIAVIVMIAVTAVLENLIVKLFDRILGRLKKKAQHKSL